VRKRNRRSASGIRTVDIATVRALAARVLRPDQMIAVARGADPAVQAALEALGAKPSAIEHFKR
jgi:hypothetical protein